MRSSVLQTSLSGIAAAEFAIGVTANNLANSQTDGFKSSRVLTSPQKPGRDHAGRGVLVASVDTDHSPGAIVADANSLNLALEGDGFFTLDGEGERLYSRGGNFRINADSQFVTATGERVLGYQEGQYNAGELTTLRIGRVSGGAALRQVQIGRAGEVRARYADGSTRNLGRLAVAHFTNPSGLSRRHDNLYAPGHNSGLPSFRETGANILGGARELSNVDIGAELIDLARSSMLFGGSLEVFRAGDEMLEELGQLTRR